MNEQEYQEDLAMLNRQKAEEQAEYNEQAANFANLINGDLIEGKDIKVIAEPDLDMLGKMVRKLELLYEARKAVLFTENEIKSLNKNRKA
jgi:hypothetical protein